MKQLILSTFAVAALLLTSCDGPQTVTHGGITLELPAGYKATFDDSEEVMLTHVDVVDKNDGDNFMLISIMHLNDSVIEGKTREELLEMLKDDAWDMVVSDMEDVENYEVTEEPTCNISEDPLGVVYFYSGTHLGDPFVARAVTSLHDDVEIIAALETGTQEAMDIMTNIFLSLEYDPSEN